MDPIEALRRIAYLLESENEVTYKVRAFRHAADALGTVDPEELVSLAARHRLTDLDGVGTTTARVIEESLGGETPSYLRKLEDERPSPPVGDVARLREALIGDFHAHSDWSDGGSSIAEMAEAARGAGHRYMALTDHSPRLTVAHGLDAERLSQQLDVVAGL